MLFHLLIGMIVIYHGQCSDGFASAWTARKRYPNAVFHAAKHGQPPPPTAGEDVLILDFAYKRPIMEAMLASARSVRLIDHHKTAAADLAGLACCEFDMNRSGAGLAWRLLIDTKTPWLIDYTEDRDLERWMLPYSREINAALTSYPFDFEVWDYLDLWFQKETIEESDLVSSGRSILRFQDRLVDTIVQHARPVKLGGHNVLAANTSTLFGEAAGRLAEKCPFGVTWYLREDGKYVHSLRSKAIDVSEIASRYGGGGHRHSAGFETPEMVLTCA